MNARRAAIIPERSREREPRQFGFGRYAFMYVPLGMSKRTRTISPFDAMR